MKTIKILLIASLIYATTICHGQDEMRNAVEFNFDYGFSNDLGPGEVYGTFLGEMLLVEDKSNIRTKNFTINYTRYFHPDNGLKFTLGFSEFGFQVSGTTDMSNTKLSGPYRVKYLEFGLSYARRIPISKELKLLIEPGIRYHSDGSPMTTSVRFYRTNSFSFSGFVGIEMPMVGNNLFTIIGFQTKLPLLRYNGNYGQPENLPYFIGLKIGFNYQF